MPHLRSAPPLGSRWLASAALLLSLALLAGCASGPGSSAQRYTLPDGTGAGSVTPSEAPSQRLVVSRVRVTDYLDAEGIVMQLDDITLNRARQHLWAEDLPRQLQRGLRQRLAERLPDTQVLGEDSRRDGAYELRLDVTQFQGRYDGQAIARGEWQLRNARGEVIALEPFSASTTLDADGYPALVRALGQSWDSVADRLASRLRELR
nr:ABC-type transport auxiliary lipoprotein family protein [Halomonas socia]